MTEARYHDCGREMETRLIDHIATWGNKRVLVRKVPALVCQKCGETLFAPEVLRIVQELARADQRPEETFIMVPVREFPQSPYEEAAAASAR